MSNNLVKRITLVSINQDGTINLIDDVSWYKYPFPFQYKLYLSRNENIQNILEMLFNEITENVVFSDNLLKYFENREKYYNELSLKYLPLVNAINNSDLSISTKRYFIKTIDLELNARYPYLE